MRSNWSRRALLGSLGAASLAGLAGCAGVFGSTRGVTDVHVHNDRDVSRTVGLTVTERGGDSPSIDTEMEVGPNGTETVNNEVAMRRDYDVAAAFTDANTASPYSETREWNDATEPLHIMLTDQLVFAVQIG